MDQEMTGAPAMEPEANSGPTPLGDIFGRHEPVERAAAPEGQPATPPEPPPTPETGEEPKPGQPRDERGQFAPKPPVAPPATREEDGRIAAVKAEREKRQAVERELADLRAKLAAPPAPPAVQQPPQQPAPPPVPLEELLFQDPARFIQTFHERQEEALLQTRLATSYAVARQFEGYDEAEAAVAAYAQSGTKQANEIAAELRSHPSPAVRTYEIGKHLLAQQRWQPILQKHQDPESFIAAEVERRMQERQQPAQPVAPAPAPRLPTSLASATSVAPRSGPGWGGPTPLSNVFGRNG